MGWNPEAELTKEKGIPYALVGLEAEKCEIN